MNIGIFSYFLYKWSSSKRIQTIILRAQGSKMDRFAAYSEKIHKIDKQINHAITMPCITMPDKQSPYNHQMIMKYI
jgi:hypothetical protein